MRRALMVFLVIVFTFEIVFPKHTNAQGCDFKIILQNNHIAFTKFGTPGKATYAPQIRFGRLFCTGELCSQLFDIDRTYDAQSKTVMLTDDYGNSIELALNENHALVNGIKKQIDKNAGVMLHITSGYTLFPMRFIFENLYPEGRIEWDESTKTATLIINDYECDNFSPDWAMQDGNPGKTRNIPEYSAPRTGNLILHVIKNFDNSGEPIIFDGKLYIKQTDQGTQLIDLKEKKAIWSANQDELMIFISAPAYKNGKIVINGIKCGNSEDGKMIWKKEVQNRSTFDRDSIIYGNNVFSSNYDPEDKNYVFCNDLDTGNTIWEHKTGFDRTEKMAIADGKVFLFQEIRGPERQKDQKQRIRCISAENGTFLWEKEITSELNPNMCADKDLVVIGDLCLDAKTGKELWRLPSKGRYLAMSEKHIIQSGGYTNCYNKKTGKQVWSNDVFCRFPVIAGSKMFGSDDKFIYCFSTKDGSELWRYEYITNRISRVGGIRQMVVSNGYIMLESINTAEIYKEK